MNVRELIAELEAIENKDLPVFVSGYEGGLWLLEHDLLKHHDKIALFYHDESKWLMGPHEAGPLSEDEQNAYQVVEGITILRPVCGKEEP